jgi:hypothetical protein
MTVREIVAKYLKDNGYDGLYCDAYFCDCGIDDLMSGSECSECIPGYKIPCNPETCPALGKCEFHIGPKEGGVHIGDEIKSSPSTIVGKSDKYGCPYCGKYSELDKWTDNKCPECGYEDVLFGAGFGGMNHDG